MAPVGPLCFHIILVLKIYYVPVVFSDVVWIGPWLWEDCTILNTIISFKRAWKDPEMWC